MLKFKTILITVFALAFVGILGTIAVLTALRQNTTKPVAPTVPQVTPRAVEPTTTAACKKDFIVAAQTHKECKNNACATVTGAGQDSCTSDSQCVPATYSYKTCENNACANKDCSPKTTPCPNLNNCQSDTDCKQTYKHKVCLGGACSLVDCSPNTTACSDSCTSDTSCITTPPPPPPPPPPSQPVTHRECRNNACVTISGSSADGCTSDVSCRPAATPPPIPRSGNTALTIGGIILGAGAILVGLLLTL